MSSKIAIDNDLRKVYNTLCGGELGCLVRRESTMSEVHEVLKTEEAAAFLRVSKPTLYKLIRLGVIPALHSGRNGSYLFSREALEEALRHPSSPQPNPKPCSTTDDHSEKAGPSSNGS